MSLYIPKMSDTPAITIQGLADNFSKIESDVANWVRVDTLSAPVLISEATYENQASIPITVPNTEDRLFAIEFRLRYDHEGESFYILTKGNSTFTGRYLPIGTIRGEDVTVRKIGASTLYRMNFYFAAGDNNYTGSIYIGGIYLVKEGV